MYRSCCLLFLPVHTKLCTGTPTLGGLTLRRFGAQDWGWQGSHLLHERPVSVRGGGVHAPLLQHAATTIRCCLLLRTLR